MDAEGAPAPCCTLAPAAPVGPAGPAGPCKFSTERMKFVFVDSPAPSFTVSVMIVIPVYTATGVTVIEQSPAVFGPLMTMPVACTSAVLLEAAVTVSEPATVRSSATVKANAMVDLPMLIIWLLIALIVGAPFTVTGKAVLAVNPAAFLTVNVIVAVPLWFAPGVTLTVRAAPLPPKIIRMVGKSVLLLANPVTVSDAAGVTASPTVNASAGVEALTLMSWLAMVVMVGGVAALLGDAIAQSANSSTIQNTGSNCPTTRDRHRVDDWPLLATLALADESYKNVPGIRIPP